MPACLVLLIGAIFGFIAALMAFLIAHEEYQKHHLGGKRLFRISFQFAATTFIFFVMLTFLAGYVLSKKVH